MPTPKVTVFVDYQNAHLSGHENWCDHGEQAHHCLIHPLKLAEATVRKRAPGGVIEQVRVYRGRPDPRKDAMGASRSDRQRSVWEADPRVKLFRRELRYPDNWGQDDCYERPREKGIDVWLAVDLVHMAMKQAFEVGIVFSRDSDLVPALELAFDMPGVHLEAAAWQGASRLGLKYRKLFCHLLSEDDFHACRDATDYT